MSLPELVVATGPHSDKTLARAEEVRGKLLQSIHDLRQRRPIPELSDAEWDRVLSAAVHTIEHEPRASFWCTLDWACDGWRKVPKDQPVSVPKPFLKWAGRLKLKDNLFKPKIGHAANGRVIRDAKGL